MNEMNWRYYILGQCSFQHNSTTQVFCDLCSFLLVCLGCGVGNPLASAVSPDCAVGAYWSRLDAVLNSAGSFLVPRNPLFHGAVAGAGE